MKSYIACLAVVLAACSSPAEDPKTVPQEAPAPPAMDLPSNESYRTPCDRPTRYVQVTVDGVTMELPLFYACDPNVSQRDLGDPPPDKVNEQYGKISNPAPVQR